MPIAMLIISGKSRIQELTVGAWSNITALYSDDLSWGGMPLWKIEVAEHHSGALLLTLTAGDDRLFTELVPLQLLKFSL